MFISNVKINDNNNITDPAINLSLEEYCVRNLDMKFDYLLFYINEPSNNRKTSEYAGRN